MGQDIMNGLEIGKMSNGFDSAAWVANFCLGKTSDELYAMQRELRTCTPEGLESLTLGGENSFSKSEQRALLEDLIRRISVEHFSRMSGQQIADELLKLDIGERFAGDVAWLSRLYDEECSFEKSDEVRKWLIRANPRRHSSICPTAVR